MAMNATPTVRNVATACAHKSPGVKCYGQSGTAAEELAGAQQLRTLFGVSMRWCPGSSCCENCVSATGPRASDTHHPSLRDPQPGGQTRLTIPGCCNQERMNNRGLQQRSERIIRTDWLTSGFPPPQCGSRHSQSSQPYIEDKQGIKRRAVTQGPPPTPDHLTGFTSSDLRLPRNGCVVFTL